MSLITLKKRNEYVVLSKKSTFSYVCPFAGSQSVHSAALPEDTAYLLLEDLQHNQTHSLMQSNTHSVKHTLADPHSQAETHAETLPHADTRLDTHPDTLAVTDTHAVPRKETDGDSHTAVLVQLQQVSAVQAANTERYERTAVE